MKNFFVKFERLPWTPFIILALTLGLAPFNPPHLVEKLAMLAEGSLIKAIDWFDLLLHGTPWALVFFKLGCKGIIMLKNN